MINILIFILLVLLLAYLLKSVNSNCKQKKLIQKEENSVKELENKNSGSFKF